MEQYARVIVDISLEKLDKAFTYRIPEALLGRLEPGMQVEVPFGQGNRQIDAYVIELADTCSYDDSQIKEISCVSQKGVAVESQLIQLAGWMKEEYGSSMLQALKTVLPVRKSVSPLRRRRVRLCLEWAERDRFLAALSPKRQAGQLRLLTALSKEGELAYETVKLEVQLGDTPYGPEDFCISVAKRDELTACVEI